MTSTDHAEGQADRTKSVEQTQLSQQPSDLDQTSPPTSEAHNAASKLPVIISITSPSETLKHKLSEPNITSASDASKKARLSEEEEMETIRLGAAAHLDKEKEALSKHTATEKVYIGKHGRPILSIIQKQTDIAVKEREGSGPRATEIMKRVLEKLKSGTHIHVNTPQTSEELQMLDLDFWAQYMPAFVNSQQDLRERRLREVAQDRKQGKFDKQASEDASTTSYTDRGIMSLPDLERKTAWAELLQRFATGQYSCYQRKLAEMKKNPTITVIANKIKEEALVSDIYLKRPVLTRAELEEHIITGKQELNVVAEKYRRELVSVLMANRRIHMENLQAEERLVWLRSDKSKRLQKQVQQTPEILNITQVVEQLANGHECCCINCWTVDGGLLHPEADELLLSVRIIETDRERIRCTIEQEYQARLQVFTKETRQYNRNLEKQNTQLWELTTWLMGELPIITAQGDRWSRFAALTQILDEYAPRQRGSCVTTPPNITWQEEMNKPFPEHLNIREPNTLSRPVATEIPATAPSNQDQGNEAFNEPNYLLQEFEKESTGSTPRHEHQAAIQYLFQEITKGFNNEYAVWYRTEREHDPRFSRSHAWRAAKTQYEEGLQRRDDDQRDWDEKQSQFEPEDRIPYQMTPRFRAYLEAQKTTLEYLAEGLPPVVQEDLIPLPTIYKEFRRLVELEQTASTAPPGPELALTVPAAPIKQTLSQRLQQWWKTYGEWQSTLAQIRHGDMIMRTIDPKASIQSYEEALLHNMRVRTASEWVENTRLQLKRDRDDMGEGANDNGLGGIDLG